MKIKPGQQSNIVIVDRKVIPKDFLLSNHILKELQRIQEAEETKILPYHTNPITKETTNL